MNEKSRNAARRRKRRVLSCLPCREHKLKCDHGTPCEACSRYGRVDRCQQHPSPSIHGFIEHSAASSFVASALYEHVSWQTDRRSGNAVNRPFNRNEAEKLKPSHHHDHRPFLKLVPKSSGDHVTSTPSHLSFLPNAFGISDIAKLRKLPVSEIADGSGSRSHSPYDQTDYWKVLLSATLPKKPFCDVLLEFFFQNMNLIYRSIHIPSFMNEYENFWTREVHEIELHWLALLFSLICSSGIGLTAQACGAHGLETKEVRQSAHLWYSASRQALVAGDWESKPSFEALQAIIHLQHYLYATKNIEALNVLLASSIRSAHALGLDQESQSPNPLRREMRHRLWWEICQSDTFQAISMQRPTLVQSYLSKVPVSLNCNDEDVNCTTIHVRPVDEPTEMSMNVARGKIFITLNKLYMEGGNRLSDYDFVASIDSELTEIMNSLPWFFKVEFSHRWAELPERFDSIPWIYHILHTCVCMQRIRMYRTFLNPNVGHAWKETLAAAQSALDVYRAIRTMRGSNRQSLRKYGFSYYQLFSIAVTLAVFLLVERPELDEGIAAIRNSIEMVVADLEQLSREETLPIALEESKIISLILEMYDSPENTTEEQGLSGTNSLVADIYTVVGGRRTTKKYLEQGRTRSALRSRDQELQSTHLDTSPEQTTSTGPIQDSGIPSPWIESMQQPSGTTLNPEWEGIDQYLMGGHIDYGYFDWDWDSVLSMGNF